MTAWNPLLAKCGKCGQTFVPGDESDLEHLQRDDGDECLGMGWLVDPWNSGDPYPAHAQPEPTDLGPFCVIEEWHGEHEHGAPIPTLGEALADARNSNRRAGHLTDPPRYYVERTAS
ncbi:MAG: hypothetical protein ACRDQD_01110 [Nocardioidaceae bacterium]